MTPRWRALIRNRRGQSLAEYALLLGLLVIGATVLLRGMGTHVRNTFTQGNNTLGPGVVGGGRGGRAGTGNGNGGVGSGNGNGGAGVGNGNGTGNGGTGNGGGSGNGNGGVGNGNGNGNGSH